MKIKIAFLLILSSVCLTACQNVRAIDNTESVTATVNYADVTSSANVVTSSGEASSPCEVSSSYDGGETAPKGEGLEAPNQIPVPQKMTAVLVAKQYLIGDTIEKEDIKVAVRYSDGSIISNPQGVELSNTELTDEKNSIIVSFEDFSEEIIIDAANPEVLEQSASNEPPNEVTQPKTEAAISKDLSQEAPSATAPVVTSTSDAMDGAVIARDALQYFGLSYVYGGESLSSGADCSGFTRAVYLQYGISLPHRAALQAGCGTPISKAEALPGDLCVYVIGDGTGTYSGHCGIYLGNSVVLQADPDMGLVCYDNADYYEFRRLFNNAASSTAVTDYNGFQSETYALEYEYYYEEEYEY